MDFSQVALASILIQSEGIMIECSEEEGVCSELAPSICRLHPLELLVVRMASDRTLR